MSRKKIVAGNWKMNMTIDESNELINELKEVSKNNVEIKIAPSFTNLYYTLSLLKNSGIEVIAQNVHSEKRGAYTGEISAKMVSDFAKYTIVGHSERRQYFNEKQDILFKKITLCLHEKIKPIFCFGETFKFKPNGRREGLLKNKKAYLVITSGGTKLNSKEDFLTPWLKFILNFFGIEKIETINADQMALDYEKSMKEAEEQIEKIT